MNVPRKAVILAAGFGTRMRPLSNCLPKPLMPLWGVPLIDHLIDMLKRWGVREVLVNLHHAPGHLVRHLQNRFESPRICLSFEPSILGTGGALVRARWFPDDNPFWVVNTDIAADLSPRPFLAEFETGRPLAALWLHPRKGPRTVEMVNGTIAGFRSARPGTENTYTFCGLQLVSSDIFRFLGRERFVTIVEAYEAAMAAGQRVAGIVAGNSFWADMGTAEQYLAAHRDVLQACRRHKPGARLMRPGQRGRITRLRRNGVHVQGFVSVGDNVNIRPGVRLEDSVVWDGATLGARAELKNAIVACNTAVSGHVRGVAVRAVQFERTPEFAALLAELGFAADRTTALPFAARGSARTFTRLACGRKTAVLIRYSLDRPENARFPGHARFLLEQGVPVPRILVNKPRQHLVVAEDLGDRVLEEEAGQLTVKRIEAPYRRVLDALLTLHRIPGQLLRSRHVRLEPPFSRALYRGEHELMTEHFLAGLPGMSRRRIDGIMHDLKTVADRLLNVPPVLVHRDMQSSNILLRHGKPVFVDFQGMRLGPAAYDLASLLCDPYVMLPPAVQGRLLDYYLARCDQAETVAGSFWPAAVERLAQALGAFGRLSALPGAGRFQAHIAPALAMLARSLAHLPPLPNLQKLVEGQWLDKSQYSH